MVQFYGIIYAGIESMKSTLLDYGKRGTIFFSTPLTLQTIFLTSPLLSKDRKVSEPGQPGSATAPTQRPSVPLTFKSLMCCYYYFCETL